MWLGFRVRQGRVAEAVTVSADEVGEDEGWEVDSKFYNYKNW